MNLDINQIVRRINTAHLKFNYLLPQPVAPAFYEWHKVKREFQFDHWNACILYTPISSGGWAWTIMLDCHGAKRDQHVCLSTRLDGGDGYDFTVESLVGSKLRTGHRVDGEIENGELKRLEIVPVSHQRNRESTIRKYGRRVQFSDEKLQAFIGETLPSFAN